MKKSEMAWMAALSLMLEQKITFGSYNRTAVVRESYEFAEKVSELVEKIETEPLRTPKEGVEYVIDHEGGGENEDQEQLNAVSERKGKSERSALKRGKSKIKKHESDEPREER